MPLVVQLHKTAGRAASRLLLLLLALAGCAPGGVPPVAHPAEASCRPFWMCVAAGDPKPKVPLSAPTGKTLRLDFAPSVLDRYEVSDKDTVLRAEVRQWRATLASGFQSGFGAAFRIVPEGAPADYVLALDRAGVSLSSLEVGFFEQVSSARADVRYEARLVDARGRVLRVSSGTAASRTFTTRGRDVTDGVVTAVAKMYEAIERDCFASFEKLPE